MFTDFFKARKAPHPLIRQNNRYFREFSAESPLGEYDFIVFDTELTGFSKKKDEIIAIGAVRISNLQISGAETFYALVKPENNSHTPSTLVHRLTPQELMQADDLKVVLPHFIEFCGMAFLAGHYVRLDFEFINRAAKKILGGVLQTPYLDTMRLAMAFNEYKHGHYYDHYNVRSSYNLAALSKEFNLPEFVEHNAMDDALQTAYLFLFLVKKMRRYGVRTMADFLKAGRNWKIIL
ncbi:MAG: 3'-5' exonuclease [Deltaproteobacteria bacterium]|nr:3'-5' exonuclease [Deltaproteobacteria bacterium]